MISGVKKQSLIFLIPLSILVPALVLSNLTFGVKDYPELHEKSFSEITKNLFLENSTLNPGISVGDIPIAIGVNARTNTIYVANLGDDTISVINGSSNTKIKDDIPVGIGAAAIGVNPFTNTIYVANQNDGTVSLINGSTNTKMADDIRVGRVPRAIGVNPVTNTIYVANHGDGTVSLINGSSNTKMADDIRVGRAPVAIGVNPLTNTIYVANMADWDVTVINGSSNTKMADGIRVGRAPGGVGVNIATNTTYVANVMDWDVTVINGSSNTYIGEDIPVGGYPGAVGVNPLTNTIYVANYLNDTVTVINGSTNTKMADDIPVGGYPGAVGVNPLTNTIYVANINNDTVSVIDGKSNELVAGVTFNIHPFNAGNIECPKGFVHSVPLAQEFYLSSSGFKCTARPNQGFEFVSWQENLGGNSSRSLRLSAPSTWYTVLSNSILDFFHIEHDKPEATLKIPRFGSFTANFKAVPPPIPPEFIAALFTVVATAFVGTWLTPAVIGWRRAKKQGTKLDHYHNEIKCLYNDGELKSKDIEKLDGLKHAIADDYSKGKINKEQYDKLGEEISVYYRKIFTNEIDSMKDLSETEKANQLSEIKNNMEDAHAEGKINELHYTLLKERLRKYEKE